MTTHESGDENISPPKISNSHIEERLAGDDITDHLYMPLSSTIVLKRKKDLLYVPLNFEKSSTIDALLDSRAYSSAISQKELDIIKQHALSNILKINDPPKFQIQVATGQLQKLKATPTFKFDNDDHFCANNLS